jgi:hypothetical protein
VEESSVDILIWLDSGADCITGYTCLGYWTNNNPFHVTQTTYFRPHADKNEVTLNYTDKITQIILECWFFLELNKQGIYRRTGGLIYRTAAARFLGLRFWIPLGTKMCVCLECCVLSGRRLCDGPIPRTQESYRVFCVWVWRSATKTLYTRSE